MKIAVPVAVLLIIGASISIGVLAYYFAPQLVKPQNRETFDTKLRHNNTFTKPIYKTEPTEYTVTSSAQKDVSEDVLSFLSSWQDMVEHATSAQVTDIAEIITSTTTYSQEEQAINLGDILSRLNEKLQTIGQSSVTDDDVNRLIYRDSTVDLGGAVKITSNANTEELRKYGNALATELTSFRIIHSNQLTVLDTFIKNSDSSNAGEALKSLANAYNNLSKDVSTLNVPSEITNINRGISNALADVSSALLELSETREDTEIYTKALEYNQKSEELAKHTLKLIDVFLFNDVRFNSYEPGSIFMFK